MNKRLLYSVDMDENGLIYTFLLESELKLYEDDAKTFLKWCDNIGIITMEF